MFVLISLAGDFRMPEYRVSISVLSVVLPEMIVLTQASHLTDVSDWPQGTQARHW